MKVLIIEDEEPAARGLIKLLNQTMPGVKILDTIISIEKAVDWFNENNEPDLVFMDIQLTDGLSFQIFEEVKIDCPIIFCTAYDQYALEAFKVNSIDYLLKPIDEKQLDKSLNKYQLLKEKLGNVELNNLSELYKNLKKEKEYKKRFMVKSGKKFFYVNRTDIAYFWTESKVVFLKTNKGQKFILDLNLENLESLLPPKDFFRINRQYIISIESLKSVENDYGTHYVKLSPDTDKNINISKYRIEAFKTWMDGA